MRTSDNSGYTVRAMIQAPSTGELIKSARKARGLSQGDLGKQVGVSQVAIKKIESNQTLKSKHLPKIAQLLDIPLEKLDRSLSANISPGEKPGVMPGTKHSIVTIPSTELIGEKNLPVHATAQGGRGALVISSEPVDWMARPEPLARVKDGYGIIVSEASMSPEFEHGDIALVHPHLPPTMGRSCVFYAQEADGETRACIKRLVKITTDSWHVRQFNPKRDYKLKRSEWQKCHVTVGNYKGR